MIIGSAVLMPCPVSGFLREDRERVVRVDGDVGDSARATRRRRAAAAALLREHVGHVHADDHAAAGERRHLKEGTAIDVVRLLFVFFMATPSVRRWPRGEWLP